MARAARERSEQERGAQPVSRLDRLLRPRSLAFIGGTAAELAIDACRSLGFPGDMWAVNRSRELRGLPTFASVDELPAGADAAFVGVDRHATIEVVGQLAAGGAGAAVCHASGFAETGEAGAALQRELVTAAAGMPLVGPNCHGTLSAVAGAALWPDIHGLARCRRGVALLSQSGNIAVNLTMQRRGLDIAWVMTLGNQADVGVSEAFEAMAADDAVTGVGMCIEALDDVERFASAAVAARDRGLPVVALKLGRHGLYLRTAVAPERLRRAAGRLPIDPAAWTGRELYRPCFQAAVSGTTGAGDSTVSGFLAAVCRGADPEAAVTAALATGACSTEAVDATSAVPPWPRIEQRLAAGWPRHPPTVVLD